eukprot:scaffold712_cov404-Prasinococcus_capsulatus_cf.AAC.19
MEHASVGQSTLAAGVLQTGLKSSSHSDDCVKDVDKHPTDGLQTILDNCMALLYTMRQCPSSDEFVYLRRVSTSSHEYNPYALEVVPYAALDSNEYYTMSAHGVTRYSDQNNADFTAIDKWEREHHIFQAISSLSVFRKFRYWKSFMTWRESVRREKFRQAQDYLFNNFFFVNPAFRGAMQRIQGLCFDLTRLRLHRIDRDALYTLDDFVLAQVTQEALVHDKLSGIATQLIGIVSESCRIALGNFEAHMDDFYGKKAVRNSIPPKAAGCESRRLDLLMSHGQTKYTYTKAAKRRSEQRKLERFVRLVDYIIRDRLQGMLVDSMSCLLSAIQPTTTSRPSPVFVVQAVFERSNLVFHPTAQDFESMIDELCGRFSDAIAGFPRLLMHEDFSLLLQLEGGRIDASPAAHSPEDTALQCVVSQVKGCLRNAFADVANYKKCFNDCCGMVLQNEKSSTHAVAESMRSNTMSLNEFRDRLIVYQQQKKRIEALPTEEDIGVFKVNSQKLVEALLPSPTKCLKEMYALLPELGHDEYTTFIAEVHEATAKLSARLVSVDDFVDLLKFLDTCHVTMPSLDKKMVEIRKLYATVEEFDMPVPELDRAAYQTLEPDFAALKSAIDECDAAKDDNVIKFSHELDREVEALTKEVRQLRNHAQHQMIFDLEADAGTVIEYLSDLQEKIGTQKEAFCRVIWCQKLFGVQETEHAELQETVEEIESKLSLWNGVVEWAGLMNSWSVAPFHEMKIEEVEENMLRQSKLVLRLERTLPANKVLSRLKDSVDEFKNTLPLIKSIQNSALKDRHWARIEHLVGQSLHGDTRITLGTVLTSKATEHGELIMAVSTEATQEHALEEILHKTVSKWTSMDLVLNPYKEQKDVYILGSVEEIIAALEDSMVTMTALMSSRFVTGIRSEADKIDRRLCLFNETLDEWLICQKNWMYLEPIFTAPDIQRQLPNEAKDFQKLDKQFKEVMRRTKDRPNALAAGTAPGRLESFRKSNEMLDKIQKNLDDYLETKRMSFPRFYFLSNDELLEILAQTRNAQAVQPHMSKCFDGIKHLDFGKDPKSTDIFAMISAEGERVPLGRNLKARNSVENWLAALEQSMAHSLRREAHVAMLSYLQADRVRWVMEHPAQIVLMISQVYWTRAIADALAAPVDDEIKVGAANASLCTYLDTCKTQLRDLSSAVRSELTKLERKKVVALITIDVHARDIVESLIANNVSSENEFGWQMQLRYEWNEASNESLIRQTNAQFQYGYEYLGAQSRLVVTPMTDRCYMTLTGALHLRLGGAPAGPAGTGKTETTKDLAKCLGVQCVVFNCGDSLDYTFMAKFFSGLAQCGAWACFDEFNRIDIEVLSVVAQQLLTIQNALKGNLSRFVFEGRDMRLVNTFGVFITMNPGYAGRTELPDNLKALFRPMAMMIPDYSLVAEVMLFAEGFDTAKSLSNKMVKLYKLSSEQLSQQDHYDFGMRALKSVLVMAGALKREHPEIAEEIVLIRAMRDSNLPKFLPEDAALFQAIISDLFPGVQIPSNDYGDLELVVRETLKDDNLQQKDSYVLKIIQLYETLNVRFGVMLVGPTGGGKSTCLHTLARSLTKLRTRGAANENFQHVHTYVLNPKCISMGELYGEYSVYTNEWTDGLGSALIRDAVCDTTPDKKWLVFDGPVDAIWIENMNTVLDDNCTLCLPNGERIKLNSSTMRMMFEVQDLAVASPATVSRCGMVYMHDDDLGWDQYVQTWIESRLLEGAATIQTRMELQRLFDSYFQEGLNYLAKHCKEYVPSVPINNAATCCALVDALLVKEQGMIELSDPGQRTRVLAKTFAFSMAWAIGGNIMDQYKEDFSDFFKDLMGSTVMFPESGTVFDYFLQSNLDEAQFVSWEQVVPRFTFRESVPYSRLLVPTVDTCRFTYLLEALVDVDKPILLTGCTGVGKSVIIGNSLVELAEPKGLVHFGMSFSAQTQARDTQLFIESKLEKKRKTRLGAPLNKKVVIVVDDINMPAKEVYGAQPPVELLRFLIDANGFYDREKRFWKDVVDTNMVAACAPPGGGRSQLTPRLVRHFSLFSIPEAANNSLLHIFLSLVGGGLQNFAPEVLMCVQPMVNATVEMYGRVRAELLPTPAKSHYTFNLRDLSKVFQGILMISPQKCATREMMCKLWAHESLRVFHDRMISGEDKECFRQIALECMETHFDDSFHISDVFREEVFFGDFMNRGAAGNDRMYEYIPARSKIVTVMEEYLEDFNMSSSSSPMTLVFFLDAVQHITRISRILRQPRGNALLVGVGGSGKQSLTKFATFMADFKLYQIELTRGYSTNEFREDLRKMYKQCGVKNESVVFLFTDTQIVNEGFVEDINSILNSGEVPGLYPLDERERLFGELRPLCQKYGVHETRDDMYGAFIDRVRENLHIVLCMSPVGESFRTRCRCFPSLINCTTIDWYSRWPKAALLSVAQRFLEGTDLGSEEVRASVCDMCVNVHESVITASTLFYKELRRRFYTTPKSYLDLIGLYLSLLVEKRKELGAARDRLVNGLTKLQETTKVVDAMQEELNRLTPVLESKSRETAELLIVVERDQEEAQNVKDIVSREEAEVSAQARRTKEIADDAKADLDEALPALQMAMDSLKALNKSDITEIKSFTKPPPLVQKTMEAVCVLLQEKPDWDTAKKVLTDVTFLRRLMEFDKDHILDKILKQLKKYIDDPLYMPETVGKQSNAAKSLCMWTRAMDVYAKVVKVVEPKRQALASAERTLEEAEAALKGKQEELLRVEGNLASLQNQLKRTQAEQKNLEVQAAETQARLQRSERLISGLADEHKRWRITADSLERGLEMVVGNVFLASASVAYCGAFTGQYRITLVSQWLQGCIERGIPIEHEAFSLRRTLSNAVEVRDWSLFGLPTDDVSVDNGILVTRGKRWPLMIDPQLQANKWVRALEERNGMKVVRLTDANYLKALENSIRIGNPVLVEDLAETIDPALEPVLEKAVVKQGNRLTIRFGDSDVDYDPNFKLYMTTKLPNPHYLPEVCIKVTLINFTVTCKGLEDQLLGNVVRKERPDLETQRDRLVVSISEDKRQLAELENKILKLLRESKGNILDDTALISTLNDSKVTSAVVQGRLEEAEEAETRINEAREKYREVATRGSILYFVVADLGLIGSMYQYSLAYFTLLFNQCIESSQKSEILEERLDILKNYITEFVYQVVGRGLFEEHKITYSFLLCTSIHRAAGKISESAWSFFVRGPTGTRSDLETVPEDLSWLSTTQYKSLKFLSENVDGFEGILEALHGNPREWSSVFERHHNICQRVLPGEWQETLKPFDRLILAKVLREDSLMAGIATYVSTALGESYTTNPPYTLDEIFKDTTKTAPIIFILSSGADPISQLQRFAERRGWTPGHRLHLISLGQGQGPTAERLISRAMESGDWVCLQNCHLSKSWMGNLERIVEELSLKSENVHSDFRLWLTSMPAEHFPVSVLQNGIKLTNEPPKGLRANLARSWQGIGNDQFERCTKPKAYKKLLFALTFFHAIVQERRKYGALGWNIRYEFNQSDIECSMQTLRMFLEEQPEVPWPALLYVTGDINYGGRVTDDLDRRCLRVILRQYYVESVLDDNFAFSSSGMYKSPPEGPLPNIIEYIRSIPTKDDPEVFGLHSNADITFQVQEGRKLVDTVLGIQPRVSATVEGKSPEDAILEAVIEMQSQMPRVLDLDEAKDGTFAKNSKGQMRSLDIVLLQEMKRFNRLLLAVTKSLKDLEQAMKGIVVMSSELELMFSAIINNQVPAMWISVGYPCLKPLASWIQDFSKRMAFMRSWLEDGAPKCYWLPGFFFPQGFLTGVLQTYARKHQTPIDALSFGFEILSHYDPDDLGEEAEDGAFVNGLFIDGARWSDREQYLEDAMLGVMHSRMPIIHFKPVTQCTHPMQCYESPLYKVSCILGDPALILVESPSPLR